MSSQKVFLCLLLCLLILLPCHVNAFGAGNIASISKIEGHNWRHGDIEDMLKTVACLKGHKWTSMMIKRVYFGNWLRDYSQAVDVGTLKGVQAGTIRILVWVLAFMSFGYATAEFEVTDERLGVYRPEEHIDNPKDYADNQDARQYDARLRPPVSPEELAVDPSTGMKNYIANESGGWATSAGYIKYSFARSIHFGRVYTHGSNKGREEDLCEALRCLGQGLHCLEDFGAHTNYTELTLRELGFNNVFPHVGTATMLNLRGKQVFPLVTGTFGGVDFLHSVLGEATDHVTQSEVDEMNNALANAAGPGSRSTSNPAQGVSGLTDLLSKIPGTGALCQEAISLQAVADAQAATNARMAGGSRSLGGQYDSSYNAPRADYPTSFPAPPGSQGGPPGPGIPGMNPNMDPQIIVQKIYPILAFRDKVVRAISNIVSKIPGLEKLIDAITERVTLFVMSLLAPFIMPVIQAASQSLKQGSSAVVDASGKHQYEVWTNPYCSDPTHSLLSKDHFSNILNEPAGQVATAILQYVAPRIVYAWDHPDVPEREVMDDVVRVFHHPAIRDQHCVIHRNMFAVVERWVHGRPDRGSDLNSILSSESVKAGHNNQGQGGHGHGTTSHSTTTGSPFDLFGQKRDMGADPAPGPSHGYPSYPPESVGYQPTPPPGCYEQTPAYDGGYQPPPSNYNQAYEERGYQQPPPAGFASGDHHAYQTAYQQGYEVPYQHGPGQVRQYQEQPAPGPPYGQLGYEAYGQAPPPRQGGYGQDGYGGAEQGQHGGSADPYGQYPRY
ncbi:hypothetical protein LTR66_004144 [Elasticomyces elasticus]|nr:hypothetical protein LTR66_004144 [Elasticomyces elasticus]